MRLTRRDVRHVFKGDKNRLTDTTVREGSAVILDEAIRVPTYVSQDEVEVIPSDEEAVYPGLTEQATNSTWDYLLENDVRVLSVEPLEDDPYYYEVVTTLWQGRKVRFILPY